MSRRLPPSGVDAAGRAGQRLHRRAAVAIANTASDLTPYNAHSTGVAASVKNGVYEASGIPLESGSAVSRESH